MIEIKFREKRYRESIVVFEKAINYEKSCDMIDYGKWQNKP